MVEVGFDSAGGEHRPAVRRHHGEDRGALQRRKVRIAAAADQGAEVEEGVLMHQSAAHIQKMRENTHVV